MSRDDSELLAFVLIVLVTLIVLVVAIWRALEADWNAELGPGCQGDCNQGRNCQGMCQRQPCPTPWTCSRGAKQ